MSDSAEIVLCYTGQAEQFMSDSTEILIFTQSNALERIVQLSDVFRQVCSAEQGQIFSLGMALTFGNWPSVLAPIMRTVLCDELRFLTPAIGGTEVTSPLITSMESC